MASAGARCCPPGRSEPGAACQAGASYLLSPLGPVTRAHGLALKGLACEAVPLHLVRQICNAERFSIPLAAYLVLRRVGRACLELPSLQQVSPKAQTDAA